MMGGLNEAMGGAPDATKLKPLVDRNSEIETNEQHFPFTDEELEIWASQGSEYVRRVAIEILYESVSRYKQRNPEIEIQDAEKIDDWTGWLRKKIEESLVELELTKEPRVIVGECHEKLHSFESDLNSKINAVEDEYGDWKKVWGASRRALAKHNYEVSIHNVKVRTRNDRFSIRWDCKQQANQIREQIEDAVETLIRVDLSSEILTFPP